MPCDFIINLENTEIKIPEEDFLNIVTGRKALESLPEYEQYKEVLTNIFNDFTKEEIQDRLLLNKLEKYYSLINKFEDEANFTLKNKLLMQFYLKYFNLVDNKLIPKIKSKEVLVEYNKNSNESQSDYFIYDMAKRFKMFELNYKSYLELTDYFLTRYEINTLNNIDLLRDNAPKKKLREIVKTTVAYFKKKITVEEYIKYINKNYIVIADYYEYLFDDKAIKPLISEITDEKLSEELIEMMQDSFQVALNDMGLPKEVEIKETEEENAPYSGMVEYKDGKYIIRVNKKYFKKIDNTYRLMSAYFNTIIHEAGHIYLYEKIGEAVNKSSVAGLRKIMTHKEIGNVFKRNVKNEIVIEEIKEILGEGLITSNSLEGVLQDLETIWDTIKDEEKENKIKDLLRLYIYETLVSSFTPSRSEHYFFQAREQMAGGNINYTFVNKQSQALNNLIQTFCSVNNIPYHNIVLEEGWATYIDSLNAIEVILGLYSEMIGELDLVPDTTTTKDTTTTTEKKKKESEVIDFEDIETDDNTILDIDIDEDIDLLSFSNALFEIGEQILGWQLSDKENLINRITLEEFLRLFTIEEEDKDHIKNAKKVLIKKVLELFNKTTIDELEEVNKFTSEEIEKAAIKYYLTLKNSRYINTYVATINSKNQKLEISLTKLGENKDINTASGKATTNLFRLPSQAHIITEEISNTLESEIELINLLLEADNELYDMGGFSEGSVAILDSYLNVCYKNNLIPIMPFGITGFNLNIKIKGLELNTLQKRIEFLNRYSGFINVLKLFWEGIDTSNNPELEKEKNLFYALSEFILNNNSQGLDINEIENYVNKLISTIFRFGYEQYKYGNTELLKRLYILATNPTAEVRFDDLTYYQVEEISKILNKRATLGMPYNAPREEVREYLQKKGYKILPTKLKVIFYEQPNKNINGKSIDDGATFITQGMKEAYTNEFAVLNRGVLKPYVSAPGTFVKTAFHMILDTELSNALEWAGIYLMVPTDSEKLFGLKNKKEYKFTEGRLEPNETKVHNIVRNEGSENNIESLLEKIKELYREAQKTKDEKEKRRIEQELNDLLNDKTYEIETKYLNRILEKDQQDTEVKGVNQPLKINGMHNSKLTKILYTYLEEDYNNAINKENFYKSVKKKFINAINNRVNVKQKNIKESNTLNSIYNLLVKHFQNREEVKEIINSNKDTIKKILGIINEVNSKDIFEFIKQYDFIKQLVGYGAVTDPIFDALRGTNIGKQLTLRPDWDIVNNYKKEIDIAETLLLSFSEEERGHKFKIDNDRKKLEEEFLLEIVEEVYKVTNNKKLQDSDRHINASEKEERYNEVIDLINNIYNSYHNNKENLKKSVLDYMNYIIKEYNTNNGTGINTLEDINLQNYKSFNELMQDIEFLLSVNLPKDSNTNETYIYTKVREKFNNEEYGKRFKLGLHEVVIDKATADKLGLKVGDWAYQLVIPTLNQFSTIGVKIVGIVDGKTETGFIIGSSDYLLVEGRDYDIDVITLIPYRKSDKVTKEEWTKALIELNNSTHDMMIDVIQKALTKLNRSEKIETLTQAFDYYTDSDFQLEVLQKRFGKGEQSGRENINHYLNAPGFSALSLNTPMYYTKDVGHTITLKEIINIVKQLDITVYNGIVNSNDKINLSGILEEDLYYYMFEIGLITQAEVDFPNNTQKLEFESRKEIIRERLFGENNTRNLGYLALLNFISQVTNLTRWVTNYKISNDKRINILANLISVQDKLKELKTKGYTNIAYGDEIFTLQLGENKKIDDYPLFSYIANLDLDTLLGYYKELKTTNNEINYFRQTYHLAFAESFNDNIERDFNGLLKEQGKSEYLNLTNSEKFGVLNELYKNRKRDDNTKFFTQDYLIIYEAMKLLINDISEEYRNYLKTSEEYSSSISFRNWLYTSLVWILYSDDHDYLEGFEYLDPYTNNKVFLKIKEIIENIDTYQQYIQVIKKIKTDDTGNAVKFNRRLFVEMIPVINSSLSVDVKEHKIIRASFPPQTHYAKSLFALDNYVIARTTVGRNSIGLSKALYNASRLNNKFPHFNDFLNISVPLSQMNYKSHQDEVSVSLLKTLVTGENVDLRRLAYLIAGLLEPKYVNDVLVNSIYSILSKRATELTTDKIKEYLHSIDETLSTIETYDKYIGYYNKIKDTIEEYSFRLLQDTANENDNSFEMFITNVLLWYRLNVITNDNYEITITEDKGNEEPVEKTIQFSKIKNFIRMREYEELMKVELDNKVMASNILRYSLGTTIYGKRFEYIMEDLLTPGKTPRIEQINFGLLYFTNLINNLSTSQNFDTFVNSQKTEHRRLSIYDRLVGEDIALLERKVGMGFRKEKIGDNEVHIYTTDNEEGLKKLKEELKKDENIIEISQNISDEIQGNTKYGSFNVTLPKLSKAYTEGGVEDTTDTIVLSGFSLDLGGIITEENLIKEFRDMILEIEGTNFFTISNRELFNKLYENFQNKYKITDNAVSQGLFVKFIISIHPYLSTELEKNKELFNIAEATFNFGEGIATEGGFLDYQEQVKYYKVLERINELLWHCGKTLSSNIGTRVYAAHTVERLFSNYILSYINDRLSPAYLIASHEVYEKSNVSVIDYIETFNNFVTLIEPENLSKVISNLPLIPENMAGSKVLFNDDKLKPNYDNYIKVTEKESLDSNVLVGGSYPLVLVDSEKNITHYIWYSSKKNTWYYFTNDNLPEGMIVDTAIGKIRQININEVSEKQDLSTSFSKKLKELLNEKGIKTDNNLRMILYYLQDYVGGAVKFNNTMRTLLLKNVFTGIVNSDFVNIDVKFLNNLAKLRLLQIRQSGGQTTRLYLDLVEEGLIHTDVLKKFETKFLGSTSIPTSIQAAISEGITKIHIDYGSSRDVFLQRLLFNLATVPVSLNLPNIFARTGYDFSHLGIIHNILQKYHSDSNNLSNTIEIMNNFRNKLSSIISDKRKVGELPNAKFYMSLLKFDKVEKDALANAFANVTIKFRPLDESNSKSLQSKNIFNTDTNEKEIKSIANLIKPEIKTVLYNEEIKLRQTVYGELNSLLTQGKIDRKLMEDMLLSVKYIYRALNELLTEDIDATFRKYNIPLLSSIFRLETMPTLENRLVLIEFLKSLFAINIEEQIEVLKYSKLEHKGILGVMQKIRTFFNNYLPLNYVSSDLSFGTGIGRLDSYGIVFPDYLGYKSLSVNEVNALAGEVVSPYAINTTTLPKVFYALQTSLENMLNKHKTEALKIQHNYIEEYKKVHKGIQEGLYSDILNNYVYHVLSVKTIPHPKKQFVRSYTIKLEYNQNNYYKTFDNIQDLQMFYSKVLKGYKLLFEAIDKYNNVVQNSIALDITNEETLERFSYQTEETINLQSTVTLDSILKGLNSKEDSNATTQEKEKEKYSYAIQVLVNSIFKEVGSSYRKNKTNQPFQKTLSDMMFFYHFLGSDEFIFTEDNLPYLTLAFSEAATQYESLYTPILSANNFIYRLITLNRSERTKDETLESLLAEVMHNLKKLQMNYLGMDKLSNYRQSFNMRENVVYDLRLLLNNKLIVPEHPVVKRMINGLGTEDTFVSLNYLVNEGVIQGTDDTILERAINNFRSKAAPYAIYDPQIVLNVSTKEIYKKLEYLLNNTINILMFSKIQHLNLDRNNHMKNIIEAHIYKTHKESTFVMDKYSEKELNNAGLEGQEIVFYLKKVYSHTHQVIIDNEIQTIPSSYIKSDIQRAIFVGYDENKRVMKVRYGNNIKEEEIPMDDLVDVYGKKVFTYKVETPLHTVGKVLSWFTTGMVKAFLSFLNWVSNLTANMITSGIHLTTAFLIRKKNPNVIKTAAIESIMQMPINKVLDTETLETQQINLFYNFIANKDVNKEFKLKDLIKLYMSNIILPGSVSSNTYKQLLWNEMKARLQRKKYIQIAAGEKTVRNEISKTFIYNAYDYYHIQGEENYRYAMIVGEAMGNLVLGNYQRSGQAAFSSKDHTKFLTLLKSYTIKTTAYQLTLIKNIRKEYKNASKMRKITSDIRTGIEKNELLNAILEGKEDNKLKQLQNMENILNIIEKELGKAKLPKDFIKQLIILMIASLIEYYILGRISAPLFNLTIMTGRVLLFTLLSIDQEELDKQEERLKTQLLYYIMPISISPLFNAFYSYYDEKNPSTLNLERTILNNYMRAFNLHYLSSHLDPMAGTYRSSRTRINSILRDSFGFIPPADTYNNIVRNYREGVALYLFDTFLSEPLQEYLEVYLSMRR